MMQFVEKEYFLCSRLCRKGRGWGALNLPAKRWFRDPDSAQDSRGSADLIEPRPVRRRYLLSLRDHLLVLRDLVRDIGHGAELARIDQATHCPTSLGALGCAMWRWPQRHS
jgi:hypothetical protein